MAHLFFSTGSCKFVSMNFLKFLYKVIFFYCAYVLIVLDHPFYIEFLNFLLERFSHFFMNKVLSGIWPYGQPDIHSSFEIILTQPDIRPGINTG